MDGMQLFVVRSKDERQCHRDEARLVLGKITRLMTICLTWRDTITQVRNSAVRGILQDSHSEAGVCVQIWPLVQKQ